MNYEDWKPFYYEILNDMGFSEEEDSESAAFLSEYVLSNTENLANISDLKNIINQNSVVVCGNSPDLLYDLSYFLSTVSDIKSLKFIAADGATSILLNMNIIPDIIVTDLDGKYPNDVSKQIEASNKSIVLIHAHGDNLPQLKSNISLFKNIIPTCQSKPPKGVFNFGGFTDGDRCLFLVDHFSAKDCTLVGFDFDDENVTEMKHKKLKWAKKLINHLIENGLIVKYFNL